MVKSVNSKVFLMNYTFDVHMCTFANSPHSRGHPSCQTSDKPEPSAMTQHFSARGSSLTPIVTLFIRDQSPFISTDMPKGSYHSGFLSSPYITKLNPSQPGNRWALNLGSTTWVGVAGRLVGGGGTGNHRLQWKKSYTTSLRVSSSHPHITPPPFWSTAFSFPMHTLRKNGGTWNHLIQN